MNDMEKFQKFSAFAILSLSFLGLAIIFYFEFRFYLSIPVIHLDDFYPFYVETVIASLPVITASLFLFRKYKKVIESRPQKWTWLIKEQKEKLRSSEKYASQNAVFFLHLTAY